MVSAVPITRDVSMDSVPGRYQWPMYAGQLHSILSVNGDTNTLAYSCCQKGSRSALFFLHLDAWMWLKRNRWIRSFGSTFFSWVTHLCLHNIAVSISHPVYLSVSLRGALELKLVSALVLEEISHDHERHSNVAIFLLLTETIESGDRVPNVYS